MPTEPVTYRISPRVHAELTKLAKRHGGVDRALRVVLGIEDIKRIAAETGIPARVLESGEEGSRAIAETHAKRFERPIRQKGDKTR